MFSILLDKHHKYLLTLRIVCFGAFISSIMIIYTLPLQSTLWLSINIFFLGLFNLPVIPIGFTFCIELTYPLSEALSNGVMMLMAFICGSTLSFIGSFIAEESEVIYVVYVLNGVIGLSCLATLFIKEDLRRLNN